MIRVICVIESSNGTGLGHVTYAVRTSPYLSMKMRVAETIYSDTSDWLRMISTLLVGQMW